MQSVIVRDGWIVKGKTEKTHKFLAIRVFFLQNSYAEPQAWDTGERMREMF